MDENKILQELKTMAMRELDQIVAHGKLSVQDVGIAFQLIDIVKDVKEVCKPEEQGEYSQEMGYSGLSVTTPSGNSYRSGSYTNGSSYRNRDSMGRYSSRGYSRDDAKMKVIEEMENAMQSMPSESDREVLIRAIEQLGN